MRRFNIILTELAILLVVAHAFMASIQVLGISTISIYTLPYALLAVVLVHAILSIGLTARAIRSGRASGHWYARQNAGFWTMRISGVAILIFLLFHVFNYMDIVNGVFYMREFQLGNLLMQLAFMAAIIAHVGVGVKSLLIARGTRHYKERTDDVLLALSVIALLLIVAVIAYFIQWQL